MSAPAGRASLGAALRTTRTDRHATLRARLDETGHDPAWLDLEHGVGRDLRLGVMWQRTGPGRRDRWAAALARDLATTHGVLGTVRASADGVEIHVPGNAAEIVARQAPKLTPMPESTRKLLTPGPIDPARAVRDAERVLGQEVGP